VGKRYLRKPRQKLTALEFRGAKTMGAKIAPYEEQAMLSYQLATIECALQLDYEPTTLNMGEMDKPELRTLFAEYEFKRWLVEVSDGVQGNASAVSKPLSTDTEAFTDDNPQHEHASLQEIDKSKYEIVLTQQQLNGWTC